MGSIKLLDCTLRDGGCVNDFRFGQDYMEAILEGVEDAGIEIIELGYLDEKAGSFCERTQYANERVISNILLKQKKPNATYVAMVDYGRFDPDLLMPRDEASIDGIRLAFHKKDRFQMIPWAKRILAKGYQLFIQPMTCLRYTDIELAELINSINQELSTATAFYIVDSFGEMRHNDMVRMVNLVDHNLNANIAMGFHAHNNLQLAYSNAVTMLSYDTKRDKIFDVSIMGMGKGAGNTTTELFAEHLNIYASKNYRITPLLEVIDKALNQIYENHPWGYAIEYYLSACKHCTPSYAGHFYRKHNMSVDQVSELLDMIHEEKKISFDRTYADELYYEYNSKKYNDEETLALLEEEIAGKEVLLVAPGKSVSLNLASVFAYADREDVFVISVNNFPAVLVDYVLVTKKTVLELNTQCAKLILTSNVSTNRNDGLILSYSVGYNEETGKTDNALFVAMNTLVKLNVKRVTLAGFDGFSADIDSNYYDPRLKRPVSKEQADRRNKRAQKYLMGLKDKMEIRFLTPSLYEGVV